MLARTIPATSTYTMRRVKLGVKEEERDIGVVITKNLKPSEQCSKAAGRATGVLNQLKRNFHYRDHHTFMKLYKQYVRPHLEFSTPAWSPWAVGDKENLEQVQEKAVKMVAGLKSRGYKDRCKELGLETLEERREKQDVALVHKLVLSGQHRSSRWQAMETGQEPDRQGENTGCCLSSPERIQESFPLLLELWIHGMDCLMR
jgi:hypothetical protein